MAYSTIIKPQDYYNTKLYTGNTPGQSITGIGFKPDWCWFKGRVGGGFDNSLRDIIRGSLQNISSNSTAAENTSANSVLSFDTDGFTLGTDNQSFVNENGTTYVAWNWKANGAGSSNSDGDTTATVSANTTSGFSMVYYNTGGSGTQSMGHGLGSAPELIITKPTQNTESWYVYSKTLTNSNILKLNASDASSSSGVYAYAPTDSVFSVSNSAIGGYTGVMSYCFKSIKGFSAISSYTGNGNADGTFVYTGFKPAFVMIKRTDAGDNWNIFDSKRVGYNYSNYRLFANSSSAEETSASAQRIDIVSNGFKLRSNETDANGSGNSYIYMSFAESPFTANVDGGLPTTAR